MKISEISIKRPVLATMMSAAIVLFGLAGLNLLPVRELPDIDPPVVSVTTVYPGANARVVETEVTEKIEEVVAGIEGIKKITSTSRQQVSNVTLEFELSRDIDLAAQDVRDRVSRIRGELPDEIEESVIAKQDADARPMLWVAMFSEERSTLELTRIAEDRLKEPLQTVNGVSQIFLGGQKRFAIRILLDPEKMAAREVTVLDVQNALQTQNVDLPSGRVENLDRELTIFTRGDLQNAEEFNRLIIRENNLGIIRLEDIGEAVIGVEDQRGIARYNSQPAVGLGVVRQSKANTIQVAKGIKSELERLGPGLPEDIQLFVAYDESVFIEQAINQVWVTLGVAFLLVVLVILLFLRNLRTTFIPCITVPVSIVGTFFFIWILGFSINILTMLALVLVIGIVVDDSIVVLENIFRHIEEGMQPLAAAAQGMKEITFAVIATTAALVSVFLPFTFLRDQVGRLFVEFALSLALAVCVSSFVALTLTPMLCSRILKKPDEGKKPFFIFRVLEAMLNGINRFYATTLRFVLKPIPALLVLVVWGACVWGTYFLYTSLPETVTVDEDKSRMFGISFSPEGATPEYTDRMLRQMEAIVKQQEETAGYFSAVALPFSGAGESKQAIIFVRFKDRSDRERSAQEIILYSPESISARFNREVEGAFAIASLPNSISRGFGEEFQLNLMSNDLNRLYQVSEDIKQKIQQAGIVPFVRSDFEINRPELRVNIDRDRAASLGVSIRDISRTLQIQFGGLDVSNIKEGGKEYEVIIQLDRPDRLTPTDIERLYVRGRNGQAVKMSNLVTLTEGAGPNQIGRVDRFRASTLSANPGQKPLGQVIREVEAILEENLPEDFRYSYGGQAETLQDTGTDFLLALVFALVLIYMVLASQFESFTDPLTILFTVPCSMVGALGALMIVAITIPFLPGMNLNIYSKIGLFLLIGLAAKNAILLVEFANQKIMDGLSATEAMIEAGKIRFRPIIMTSISTVAGMIPLIIGFGAGEESRRPLGIVAVFGLLAGLVLTLYVAPVWYVLFAQLKAKLFGQSKKETLESREEILQEVESET